MKLTISIFLLSFYAFSSFAQPMYSPEIRAKRENKWMTDSLRITAAQGEKAYTISLNYYQQMDKASQLPDKQKNKTQQKLMNKKDTDLKALLDKEQYQKYIRDEKQKREREKARYNSTHQPM